MITKLKIRIGVMINAPLVFISERKAGRLVPMSRPSGKFVHSITASGQGFGFGGVSADRSRRLTRAFSALGRQNLVLRISVPRPNLANDYREQRCRY
jgi:hypothetical protein